MTGATRAIGFLDGIGSLRGQHNAQNALPPSRPAWRSGSTVGEIQSGLESFPGPGAPHGAGRPQGPRALRQRFQGDQCRCRGAGAVELPAHLLDRRRPAQGRRHRAAAPLLSAHRQGLSDRRGGAGLLPRRWARRCPTRSPARSTPRSSTRRATRPATPAARRSCCCRRPAPASTSSRISRCAAKPSAHARACYRGRRRPSEDAKRMMSRRAKRSPVADWWWTVDRWFLAAFLLLMGLGIVLSFAASPAVAERIGLDSFHFVKRQIVFMIPALIVMISVSFLSARQIRRAVAGHARRHAGDDGGGAVHRRRGEGRASLDLARRRVDPAVGIPEAGLRRHLRLAVRRARAGSPKFPATCSP